MLIINIFQLKISLLTRSSAEADFKILLGLSNYTIDVCSYMNGGFNSKLIDTYMSSLKKYSNMMHPCPYSVNYHYFIIAGCAYILISNLIFQGHFYTRDMALDASHYPIPLPAGEYKLKIFTYTVRDEKILWILEINGIGELKRK